MPSDDRILLTWRNEPELSKAVRESSCDLFRLHSGSFLPGPVNVDQPLSAGHEHRCHLLRGPQSERNTRLVMHAGLLYTLGRCLLYLVLAMLLTMTALSIPAVSIFLQKYMHLLLGPVFLLLGMFLVGLITVLGGGTTDERGPAGPH